MQSPQEREITEDPPAGQLPDGFAEATRDLPPSLLQGAPRWYPGTWAPPAITLTIASILVFLASLSFVFRNALTRNLFRFPVPEGWSPAAGSYYLAIPAIAAALAWLLVRRCANRPGPNLPRYWVFLLALICTGITLYSLVDCFLIGNERGNPAVHGTSAAALMAVLTLLPRLKRVFPYEGIVLHVAALSMVIVLLAGIPVAWWIGESIINYERSRVESASLRVKQLTSEIDDALGYNWSTLVVNPAPAKRQAGRLESISLVQALPDAYVWQAAKILGNDAELKDAVGSLASEVAGGISRDGAPRLNIPRYRLDPNGEKWESNARFADAAAVASSYYREVKRLMDELESDLSRSPAADAFLEAKRGYMERLKSLYGRFDQHWIASTAAPKTLFREESFDRASLLHLADTQLQPAALPLGDFAAWKQLPWSQALSLMMEGGSCSDRRTQRDERVRRERPDPLDATKVVVYYDTYRYYRVECYSYAATDDKPGVDMLAQIDLTYKTDANVALPAANREPLQTSLYVYLPRGQQQDEFLQRVMQDFAAAAEKVDTTPPRNLSGNSPGSGFAGKGYAVSRPRFLSLTGQVAAMELRIQ
jgi:hypothetical protein